MFIDTCSVCSRMPVQAKRTLAKRVSEHIYNITIGFKEHSLSLHFREKHNRNLKFWVIDKLHPRWRGANMVQEISKRESHWIFLTNTLCPNGLNIELDLNCFISNY